MRVLLAIHNAYTDNTSGAARSIRTIVEWLASLGIECRVVCTARFDARPPESISDHLDGLGVDIESLQPPKRLLKNATTIADIKQFCLNRVGVTMLITRHNTIQSPDPSESEQFIDLVRYALKNWQPDVLLTYGAHPCVGEVLRQARNRGVRTVFSVRNYGYEDVRWYTNIDQVLTCSPYLSRHYRRTAGLYTTGIVSPIKWTDVLASDESRAFVTFVHPARHKGAALFARLADMLGSKRPDIPILVVQSAADATELNSIPGIDFSRYPQILAAPSVSHPSDFFELAKIVLVPSVFHEPFGRVAAESLINGIPPIVSNRGALPETVQDAGIVIPLPDWLTPASREIPTEKETLPWFDAVCNLWDNEDEYARLSALGRETAQRLYSEEALKSIYLQFFNDPPRMPLFEDS